MKSKEQGNKTHGQKEIQGEREREREVKFIVDTPKATKRKGKQNPGVVGINTDGMNTSGSEKPQSEV